MKQRLSFLASLYALLVGVFALQKPLFLWLDQPGDKGYAFSDVMTVVCHGLLLDIPVTGYLIALPLLFVIASAWLPWPAALRRLATPYYALVAVVVMLVFVADASLYPFWKFKLDATIFYYMDSPKDAFASVSMWYLLLRLLAIIILSGLFLWALRAVTPRCLKPMKRLGSRVGLTLLLLALTGPLAISIRGGLGESTANIGKVYFSGDEYLNHAAVNPCFSMIASLGKAENYGDEFNFFPEAERAALFEGLYAPTPTDTVSLLNTDRPNVIIILMEGFGGQFVEAVSGRADISPCYNRLAHEGVLFTHCYSNSFRTDRGTVSALSGYPSFPTLSVMKIPMKSRTLPCIARTLNEQGYTSSFLYGGDINFTNMQSYLRTGGYSSIVSDVDFAASERKDNPWGANDDVTFGRLYEMIAAQKHTPWHIGYLTLSSHEPWKVPYKRLDEEIPNAFAFTDHCLGEFIARMKKTAAWNDLLIVCIPDHGFQYPSDITNEQHHHNTMLWLGGAVRQPRVVTTLMNQSDMAATLLGQLRIDHTAYTFSRDVMSEEYGHYPFAFYTNKERVGLADSTGCTDYDIIGGTICYDRPENGQNDETLTRRRADKARVILQSIYDDLGAR